MNHFNKKTIKILEGIGRADQHFLMLWRSGEVTRKQLITKTVLHTKKLNEILDKCGFPNKTNASKMAYKASVLVALHSGDKRFMKNFLKILIKQPAASIDLSDSAVLIDKIAVLEKKYQIYGTQSQIGLRNNISDLYPIVEIDGVNKRRREVGLAPLKHLRRSFS